MKENMQKQNLNFLELFTGILLKPRKTWKKIAEVNSFSYIWTWFIIQNVSSVAIVFFYPTNRVILLFIGILTSFWIGLLVIWLFLVSGFKIAGIKTTVSFWQIFRLFVYTLILDVIFEIVAVIRLALFPELKNIFGKLQTNPDLLIAQIIFLVLFLIYVIWSSIIFVTGVRHVYRISYKRSFTAVFAVPLSVVFFIISMVLIKSMF